MKIISNAVMGNINNKKVDDLDNGSFDEKMNSKKAGGDVKTKLKGLLERIDVQASKLSNRLSIEDLKEYKRLVSEFLDISISNSHKFSKERILDHRGRHRIFGMVKKVNEELDMLTQEVLKNEKNRIGILEKMGDIRGILVDIMA